MFQGRIYSLVDLYFALFQALDMSQNHWKQRQSGKKKKENLAVIFTPLSVKQSLILSDQKAWWTSTVIIFERWQLQQTINCHWLQHYCHRVWLAHQKKHTSHLKWCRHMHPNVASACMWSINTHIDIRLLNNNELQYDWQMTWWEKW